MENFKINILKFKSIVVFFIFLSHFVFCQSGYAASGFTVTAIGDKHENISQKIIKVKTNKKATFNIKTKKGYTLSKLVAGNCPKGHWQRNNYTTGAIKKNCKVYFSAGLVGSRIVKVTPSGDQNLVISPNNDEKIISGTLAQFKVTAKNSGDSVSRTVTGTCPKGVWLDEIYYKIGPVIKNCVVNFSIATGGGGSGSNNTNCSIPSGNIHLKWVDSSGGILIPSIFPSLVKYVDGSTKVISKIAGVSFSDGDAGNGGLAVNAELYFPLYAVKDLNGNVYISDTNNFQIRKIDNSGIISTYAGHDRTYNGGDDGDGGPATAAHLSDTRAVITDDDGNLYISDIFSIVRKVDSVTGIITTIAGDPNIGNSYSGDGGAAVAAGMNAPSGMAFDSDENLYIADSANHAIRMVNKTTNIISTIAGGNGAGLSGDEGPATSAQLNNPKDVVIDSANNVYISDSTNSIIRKVDSQTGIITTFASVGANSTALTLDLLGNLYYSSPLVHGVYKLNSDCSASVVAGTFNVQGNSGDGGPATSATLSLPFDF